MSKAYRQTEVFLSAAWESAPTETLNRVTDNMQKVFWLLHKDRINDPDYNQELRELLKREKGWLDYRAYSPLQRLGGEHRSGVFHFVQHARAFSLVEPLLEAGFDIDLVDGTDKSYTAFYWAVKRQDVKAIHIFAKHGADIEQPLHLPHANREWITPLQYALTERLPKAARALLGLGAKYNQMYDLEHTVAQHFTMAERCMPGVLTSFVWTGFDPLTMLDEVEQMTSAMSFAYNRNSMSARHMDALILELMNIGVPIDHFYPKATSISFPADNLITIVRKVREDAGKVLQEFSENKNYDALSKVKLALLSNIGELDGVFRNPIHWRNKANAERALGLLEMLPPYLQENYTHERSLIEAATQTKQTGWVR